jgi:hypothetical protein
MAMTFSGCEQKSDVEPNETDVSFDKELEEFYQKAVRSPYQISSYSPSMVSMVDIANIRLSYANYKSSGKLRTAIEEFNRSSTALANKMLYLTIVIAVLTLVMAFLTVVQVVKPTWRFLLWMRKIVVSLAQSCMQRFAKTETGTTSPVKQYEGGNKSKDSSEKTPCEEPEAHRREDEN